MTLVQASIAENGNAIILISDRLLTRYISGDIPPYEFESNTPKIIGLGTVALGFAGSELHASNITSFIKEKGNKEFNKIVKLVSEYMVDTRSKEIEKEIKRRTGINNANDFFTNPNLPIPSEVRESIYAMMGERRRPIVNCQCIVAGFDEKKEARIVIIDELGDVFDLSDSGHAAIGSGAPFSTIYFDQYGYSISMGIEDAVFFSFEAKKWAEAPRGVGRRTDIILIRKEGDEIRLKLLQDGSEALKIMEKFYQDKRQLMMRRQKKLREEIRKFITRD